MLTLCIRIVSVACGSNCHSVLLNMLKVLGSLAILQYGVMTPFWSGIFFLSRLEGKISNILDCDCYDIHEYSLMCTIHHRHSKIHCQTQLLINNKK